MVILPLIAAAVGLGLIMALAFAVQRRTGRSGFIDAIWSFATAGAGVFLVLAPGMNEVGVSGRQVAVTLLATVWGLRLSSHILMRTLGGGEDPRYLALQQEWGADFPRRLFWFLQVQAACAFLLAATLGLAGHRPGAFPDSVDLGGFALLIVAIGGAALADKQLARFRRDPSHRGLVCASGLWSVSRHPNYFFEWLGWLAIAVVAVDPAGQYWQGLFALTGPAFMYWLLVHVSGIPPLEAHMLRSRGDAFRAYQARVNAFFPGKPAT